MSIPSIEQTLNTLFGARTPGNTTVADAIELLDMMIGHLSNPAEHTGGGGCLPCVIAHQQLIQGGVFAADGAAGPLLDRLHRLTAVAAAAPAAGGPPAAGHRGGRRGDREPPPAPDVLDTVDDDGQLRCACGCRQTITDQSPSAYYASQDCQSRYLDTQVTAPLEVYTRYDAALNFTDDTLTGPIRATRPAGAPEALPALAWLDQIPDEHRARADINHSDGGLVSVAIPPPPTHRYSLIDYTRWCPQCRTSSSPWTFCVVVPSDQEVRLPSPPELLQQQCGACRADLAPGVFLATIEIVEESPTGDVAALRLRLQDGLSQASWGLATVATDPELLAASPTVQLARNIWHRLTGEVARFAEEWSRTSRQAVPAGPSIPYQLVVSPPPPPRRGRQE